MKASELIQSLQHLIETQGDLSVAYMDYSHGTCEIQGARLAKTYYPNELDYPHGAEEPFIVLEDQYDTNLER